MAWTTTITKTVFGNLRAHIVSCTADAATQSVETGLANILGIAHAYGSMATVTSLMHHWNSNASGVATPGTIGCSGFTSGDDICFVCFGT